jgi:hypothetical protein
MLAAPMLRDLICGFVHRLLIGKVHGPWSECATPVYDAVASDAVLRERLSGALVLVSADLTPERTAAALDVTFNRRQHPLCIGLQETVFGLHERMQEMRSSGVLQLPSLAAAHPVECMVVLHHETFLAILEAAEADNEDEEHDDM